MLPDQMIDTTEIPVSEKLKPFHQILEVTEESRTWAAAHLADLPTMLRWVDEPVDLEQTPEGIVFRRAFYITASPAGKRRIAIHLLRGASERDLDYAHHVIERAKAGNLADWRQSTNHTGPHPHWYFNLLLECKELPHDELRPCTDSACIDEWHPHLSNGGQFDFHRGETIDHPEGAYSIAVLRTDDGPWEISVDVDGLSALPEASILRAARDLINDAAWLRAEADRLNAAALAAETAVSVEALRAAA